MKNDSLCRYFSDTPAWQRQLEQLRQKAQAGYADGFIRLEDASPDECLAAERFLGKHFVPPKLKYRMSDFEKALQKSRFSIQDLQEFWLQLDGRPLLSHSCQKANRQNTIDRFFAAEAKQPHGDAAANWLRSLCVKKGGGFQLLIKHMEQGPEAADWLHWVCCALDRLQQRAEPEELALCSCAITTDPHALDLNTPAGRLLLHALSYWQGCEFPTQSRTRLALLRRCGLMLDDISNFTAQRGLIFSRRLEIGGTAESMRPGQTRLDPTQPGQTQPCQVHPSPEGTPQNEGFCLLTLSQLEDLYVESPTGKVYLLENQMVFSSLCHRCGIRQPMICTSGQFREASWRLLDLLHDSGCTFWYAGDFDPEGLGIADRLWQAHGDRVQFWHMTPEDYRQALSPRARIEPARLPQLKRIQCPALRPVAEAILEQKAAGYQEALIEQYFHDLCK